jgi:transposase InsO family protein
MRDLEGESRDRLFQEGDRAVRRLVVLDRQMHGARAAVDGHREEALAGFPVSRPELREMLDVEVHEAEIIVLEAAALPFGAVGWKGVGRIDQQTFIDTYTKVGFAKLYDRKTPITAADLLNDRVIPFFEAHAVALLRVLTDRGTEYCGSPERHEYELYLAVENIDHSRTKARSPQTNGICERFHKTMLDEFDRVAFRKTIYRY